MTVIIIITVGNYRQLSSYRCTLTHKGLTVEDTDSDGLLLLNGLCVGEACVTDVVSSGIFLHNVGEVKISIQTLRDTLVLRETLEI